MVVIEDEVEILINDFKKRLKKFVDQKSNRNNGLIPNS